MLSIVRPNSHHSGEAISPLVSQEKHGPIEPHSVPHGDGGEDDMENLFELHCRQKGIVYFIQEGELVGFEILLLCELHGIQASGGILYGMGHLVGHHGKQPLVLPAKSIIV